VKHLLIILFILISCPLLAQKIDILYLWETSAGKMVWKKFGDEEFHLKYKGDVKKGKPDGYGVLYHPDGKKLIGEWKSGKEYKTKHYINGKIVAEFNFFSKKQWTRQFGVTHIDSVYGVATDSSGNSYIAGSTKGGLDGNKNKGGECWFSEEKEECTDTILVKFDSAGTKKWTRQFGIIGDDSGYGVTTDYLGNIYVTGVTHGGLDGNTSSGESDIFLVKFNSFGKKLWTKQLGTSSSDWGNSVTTDLSGNIYVTGVTLGGLDGNTSSGESDIFLVKFNSFGKKLWTRQLGTSGMDRSEGITIDPSGNIYITGITWGVLDGDKNLGKEDIFLVKFNSFGKKLWTRQLGTSGRDFAKNITSDSSGNIYVTGTVATMFDHDGEELLEGNTNSEGPVFLTKFDTSGKIKWTNQLWIFPSLQLDITIDPTDSIYLASGNNRVIRPDENSECYKKHASRGCGDECDIWVDNIVLVKFNSSGMKLWINEIKNFDWAEINGVSTDSSGNIYVAGDGILSTKINSGKTDGIFLIKYNSSDIQPRLISPK